MANISILIQKLNTLSWRISASLNLSPGIIMVGVIIGCKRMGLNPDNVATPIAASFGDLITLALLVCFSQWFYSFMGERTMDIMLWLVTLHKINQNTEESFFINIQISATYHSFWYSPGNKCTYNSLEFLLTELYPYVLYLADLFYLCLIPVWMTISSKHPASHILLYTGWEPIIAAMIISRYLRINSKLNSSWWHVQTVCLYIPCFLNLSQLEVSFSAKNPGCETRRFWSWRYRY